MRTRHDAALALIGWYLMLAPPQDLHGPISRWAMQDSYDTADARALPTGPGWLDMPSCAGSRLPDLNDPENEALCIATDDPRLKE